jgi:hypothetical protein
MTKEEFLTKHGWDKAEDLQAVLTQFVLENEKITTVYGRIFRADARNCIHGAMMGDHCHKCPQCKCPNKIITIENGSQKSKE